MPGKENHFIDGARMLILGVDASFDAKGWGWNRASLGAVFQPPARKGADHIN
jgi:hypothetical protein